MADIVYAERARRQRNRLILLGVLLLLGVCAIFAVRNSFYDLCTGSFNRDPKAVVDSYLQAINNSDPVRAQDCWDHNAFFDLSAGCSEVCLSRLMGANLTISSVEVESPSIAENGRARITAQVSATCPEGESVSGSLVLDSLASGVPWKHWRVIRSEVGGSANQTWCKK